MTTETTTVEATQEAILKLTLAYDKKIHEEVSLPDTQSFHRQASTPNSTNTRRTSLCTMKKPAFPLSNPLSLSTVVS